MNPNDNFISPGSSLPGQSSDKKFFLLIGLVVAVVLLIGGGLLLLGGGKSAQDQLNQLSVQLTDLKNLTTDSGDNLRQESTHNFNSELQLTLASDQASLSSDLGLKAPDDKTIQALSDSRAASQLARAKTNGTYDQVYQKIVIQKLSAINAQASEVYRSTNNPQIKQSMESVYEHFTELDQRLSDIKL
ncbi:MAG TPA: hypothetical protein VFL81_00425 [Candidatus Saccharimonadales bacterium]|nr:hypothetical protein [Candidatus Saccharimonadales bacterium]